MFTIDATELTVYNAKALIDYQFTGLTFVDDSSYFFRVYDEREGRELKDFTSQLSKNGTTILNLNASVSDMTFDDPGKYYYELGYVKSGGYDEILKYGTLKVI